MGVERQARAKFRVSQIALLIVILAGITISYLAIKAADAEPENSALAALSPTPNVAETKKTKKGTAQGDNFVTDIDRSELLKRTVPLGNPVHTTLEKPETVVEQISTPYFATGAVYRVSTRPPERPRVYNLGVWGNDGVILLNEEPDNFYKLASMANLRFSSGSDYVAYVVTFLETTSGFKRHPQILNSIEKAWWVPKPDAAEAQKRDEMIAKYSSTVEPPKLSSDAESTVVLYAISNLKLVMIKAKVASDGKIKLDEKVLEENTPTVMMN
ncbi:MAG: hypothetical protein LC113_08130 [Acidobacteria bacterium]|nr:hypothetical protein [Acidobacteriota bacterium]